MARRLIRKITRNRRTPVKDPLTEHIDSFGTEYRVAPWSEGVVKGFVVLARTEAGWFPYGMVRNTREEAQTAMESIQ